MTDIVQLLKEAREGIELPDDKGGGFLQRRNMSREWLSGLVDRLADVVENFEERIENAQQAASETQLSWKRRCYAIMSALGADYGDLDWEMPRVTKLSDMQRRVLEGVCKANGGRFCSSWAGRASRVTTTQAYRALCGLLEKGLVERDTDYRNVWCVTPRGVSILMEEEGA